MRECTKFETGISVIAHGIAIKPHTRFMKTLDNFFFCKPFEMIRIIEINGGETFHRCRTCHKIKRVRLAV